MHYYMHLIREGKTREAEAWLSMYNAQVYLSLKPREGEVEAAQKLERLKP